jgi:hypothetical protein
MSTELLPQTSTESRTRKIGVNMKRNGIKSLPSPRRNELGYG